MKAAVKKYIRRALLRFGRLFNDCCLLLSAYSPLFLISFVRAECPSVREWLLGLGVAFSLLIFIPVTGALLTAKNDFRINEVSEASGEVAAYVAIYLLPFLTIGDERAADFEAYALFLAFIGFILIRANLLHFNPWILIFGRRIYTVRVGLRSCYLIAADAPRAGDDISAHAFADRFLLI